MMSKGRAVQRVKVWRAASRVSGLGVRWIRVWRDRANRSGGVEESILLRAFGARRARICERRVERSIIKWLAICSAEVLVNRVSSCSEVPESKIFVRMVKQRGVRSWRIKSNSQ